MAEKLQKNRRKNFVPIRIIKDNATKLTGFMFNSKRASETETCALTSEPKINATELCDDAEEPSTSLKLTVDIVDMPSTSAELRGVSCKTNPDVGSGLHTEVKPNQSDLDAPKLIWDFERRLDGLEFNEQYKRIQFEEFLGSNQLFKD